MPRAAGMTLFDLLTAVAVLGVLLGLGVPALRGFALDARLVAEVNAFIQAVHLARSEAIKRAEYVSICRSSDGATCGDGGWHDGWLVFVNADRDDPPRRDPGEAVLIVHSAWPDGSIRANRLGFTFRPFTLRSTNGTLVFCDARGGAAARAVIVSYTGRPRAAGLDAAGRPLTCP